jgi:hypothetical protein
MGWSGYRYFFYRYTYIFPLSTRQGVPGFLSTVVSVSCSCWHAQVTSCWHALLTAY